MELLRTPRLVLRHWEESDLQAFYDLYSRDDVMRWLGSHPRRTLASLDEARERLGRWRAREPDLDPPLGLWAIVPLASGAPSRPPAGTVLTDLDNVRSQAVAARLGMRDEGTTDRWFGLTARQFSKTLAAAGRGA
jgi:RimJ/RimL family protein N-acetyltransferase